MYELFPRDTPIVQKYGGTSVGNPEKIKKIAQRVASFKEDGWSRLAIVVSAMSGETNRLVALFREINPTGESTKAYDMAVSAGEQVAVGLMAAAIDSLGLMAEPLLGHQLGILTNVDHGQARIEAIDPSVLESVWESGKIPVVAGFQGVTQDGDITTLGRGGSDTSAVALAAALSAGFCEINTDVDGVFTADPRYVKEAKLLEELDYETAMELAAQGSKVLHSRCVELGAKHRVPIVVRNSFSEDRERKTTIMNFNSLSALEAPVVSGITLDRDIARVTVHGVPNDAGNLGRVFAKVAECGVNVDIIVQNRQTSDETGRFGFTVRAQDLTRAMSAIESLRKIPGLESIRSTAQGHLSKVTAVGLGMQSHSGVAQKVFETLNRAEVAIHMVSTSEIKISCVVDEQSGERAVQALHWEFFGG